jgi:pimeloyl-ACP methyl ester carboxylesterase
VTDVVNTILYEDLTDIVLLGYSYGGMVVTGALEHVADRVAHLVYLDAFKPDDGQSLRDLSGAPYQAPAIGPGAPWLVEPLRRPLADEDQANWFSARRSWHPVGCFTEPVRLPKPLEDFPFTRTYVKALQEPRAVTSAGAGTGPSAFWRAADYAKSDPSWRYREIDTDHMIPINRPAELVELLLELT